MRRTISTRKVRCRAAKAAGNGKSRVWGWRRRGTREEVISAVTTHGRDTHDRDVTEEEAWRRVAWIPSRRRRGKSWKSRDRSWRGAMRLLRLRLSTSPRCRSMRYATWPGSGRMIQQSQTCWTTDQMRSRTTFRSRFGRLAACRDRAMGWGDAGYGPQATRNECSAASFSTKDTLVYPGIMFT